MSTRKVRHWTQEEVEYLENSWGVASINRIAKVLGRTFYAVKSKARRLGLSDPLTHVDGITVHQLSQVLNMHYGLLKNWIENYNLPAKQKILVREQKIWIISYQDFWKWAERNKQMIDFSRFEKGDLGPEPDWAQEKRKADQIRKLHVPKPHNEPWSIDEDAKLKWMLYQFKYTYPEIARELKRTQAAVKRRILDLGLKVRPVYLPNHNKYTKEEESSLVEMLEKGYCFEEIANQLNRSALGVRGKAERMGYKFVNGVPIKPKKIS